MIKNVISHAWIGASVRLFTAAAIICIASTNIEAQTTRSAPVSGNRTAVVNPTTQAINESSDKTWSEFASLERDWRNCFREERNPQRLKNFVSESIGMFEKLKQVGDFASNPAASEARLGELFRRTVLNDEAICRSIELSANNYLKTLDDHDQALFIKLKIDRKAATSNLASTKIDPKAFRQPIQTAAATSIQAAQADIQRSVAALVASQVISSGVKQGAQDAGLLPGEPGSLENIITGFLIDIAIDVAVEAATDPTPQMVKDLDARLLTVERSILDGTATSPGFLSSLKRVTEERVAARRRIAQTYSSK